MTISPYGGDGDKSLPPALEKGKIALVTDLSRCPSLSLEEQAILGRDGGAHLLMLRAPELAKPDYENIARSLAPGFNNGCLLVIYDHADLALELGVAVQVGKDDDSVSSIREKYPNLIIGYSAHSLTEASQASRDGADFILLSLLFPTNKDGFGREPLEDHVWANTYEVGVPVFALGGLTTDNLPQAMEWGVRRVAVSSGVLCSPNPAESLSEFVQKLCPPPKKLRRVMPT